MTTSMCDVQILVIAQLKITGDANLGEIAPPAATVTHSFFLFNDFILNSFKGLSYILFSSDSGENRIVSC